jgi:hypothetical protein
MRAESVSEGNNKVTGRSNFALLSTLVCALPNNDFKNFYEVHLAQDMGQARVLFKMIMNLQAP